MKDFLLEEREHHTKKHTDTVKTCHINDATKKNVNIPFIQVQNEPCMSHVVHQSFPLRGDLHRSFVGFTMKTLLAAPGVLVESSPKGLNLLRKFINKFSICDVKHTLVTFQCLYWLISFHCSLVGGNCFQKLPGPSSKGNHGSHYKVPPCSTESMTMGGLITLKGCCVILLSSWWNSTHPKRISSRHTALEVIFLTRSEEYFACETTNWFGFSTFSPPKKSPPKKTLWRAVRVHFFLVRTHFPASSRSMQVSKQRSFVLSCLNAGQIIRMILTLPETNICP